MFAFGFSFLIMFNEVTKLILAHERIGIISHFRPDGDAIGSTLGLGLSLAALGKRVTLWNEDGVPARYMFLEGAEQIQPLPERVPDDLQLLICVDTGDRKRLGDRAAQLFADFPCVLNIDHHATNSLYGHHNLVIGGEAATGMVIFNLLRAMNAPLSPAVAAALYAAINTDTGSFQYSSTTPAVMRAVAELMETGIDIADINRRIYQEKPLSELRVQAEVLNNLVVEEGGRISHYSMAAGTKARLGIGLEDTKDLVDIIRVIQGTLVAIIFEDLEDGRIRMSLRSKDPRISVADIAVQFGGGGHSMAAGIRMRGELATVREQVLDTIRHAVRALD